MSGDDGFDSHTLPPPFPMARRKRKKRVYDSAGQARRLARAVIGAPPPERVVPSKKKKLPKHKKRELEKASEGWL